MYLTTLFTFPHFIRVSMCKLFSGQKFQRTEVLVDIIFYVSMYQIVVFSTTCLHLCKFKLTTIHKVLTNVFECRILGGPTVLEITIILFILSKITVVPEMCFTKQGFSSPARSWNNKYRANFTQITLSSPKIFSNIKYRNIVCPPLILIRCLNRKCIRPSKFFTFDHIFFDTFWEYFCV